MGLWFLNWTELIPEHPYLKCIYLPSINKYLFIGIRCIYGVERKPSGGHKILQWLDSATCDFPGAHFNINDEIFTNQHCIALHTSYLYMNSRKSHPHDSLKFHFDFRAKFPISVLQEKRRRRSFLRTSLHLYLRCPWNPLHRLQLTMLRNSVKQILFE